MSVCFRVRYGILDYVISSQFCFVSRCSQEMHDALQMAMTGHARLLDQYAELQEKHIILVSKMRVIRDGVANIKTVAKKSGLTCTEDRWFDAQAAQIAHLKAEQEQSKEEIKGLQSQLRDTADAVQAAGELVVRLKDAELAAVSAKVYFSVCRRLIIYIACLCILSTHANMALEVLSKCCEFILHLMT